jgi:hypothetical protein
MMFSIRPSFADILPVAATFTPGCSLLPVNRNAGDRFYFALQLGYGDRRDPHLSRCADSIVDLTRSEVDLAD